MTNKSTYESVATNSDGNTSATQGSQRHRLLRFADGWAAESLCAILGTLLIVTLCLVLLAYEGRPRPQFGETVGSELTLNTIVAIISASAKAALLLPAAQCISQYKWFWFEKDYQDLRDMDTFDEASRGICGGLELLWKSKLRLAAIGAFLMIFAVAIDPLSQQLISYRDDPFTDDSLSAKIGAARQWDEAHSLPGTFQTPGLGSDSEWVSVGIKGAILSGLYKGNTLIQDVAPKCPRGNCTFDTYSTLAVCSSVPDITSSLVLRTVNVTNPSFSNPPLPPRYYASTHQFFSSDGYSRMNISSATFNNGHNNANKGIIVQMEFPDSVAFKGVNAPIADVIAIYESKETTEGNHIQYRAVEFMMEWCVQELTTSVLNGVPTTQRVSSHRDFTWSGLGVSANLYGEAFNITYGTHYSLQRYLAHLLRGTGTTGATSLDKFASSDSMDSLYQPFDWFAGSGSTKLPQDSLQGTGQAGLEHIVRNMATSMTT